MGRAARGRRQCGDPADTQHGYAGREYHATPLVLVLPQWVPLLQGRRQPVLLGQWRAPTTRDLWWGPSYSVHPSDLAPALVALNATFEVTGPGGPRRIAAADFFVLPSQNPARENALVATELLTGVRMPTPAAGVVSTYLKITDRAAWTHAEVSVAVVLHVEGERIRTAGVVLGGVAPMPWRLTDVEQFLRGTALSAAVAGQAGALAIANAQPLAKNGHKVPMTSAAVERALLRLVPTDVDSYNERRIPCVQ